MVLGPVTDSGGTTIDAGSGSLGGPVIPLRGYVGEPALWDFVVDADDTEVGDASGSVLISANGSNSDHVAGHLPFITVAIQASRPGVAIDFAMGWGSAPWGALSLVAPSIEETINLTASDVGFRTDGTPSTPYPPFLASGLTLDARIPLSPAQVGIVWGWGGISLINANGRYNGLPNEWNVEGRPVVIKYGVKSWDDERGLFVDPLETDLEIIFVGVASGWVLSEFALDIRLRDASFLLEKPLQTSLYAGTGTYEGDVELAGTPKPLVIGKAFNVPLTLIDRANRIYQYHAGPGSVVALFEGAAETITFQAPDTNDLYTGTTTSGNYRTDNSRGLIQLGAAPADGAALTANVIGQFPVAGAQLIWANIARYVMTEIMAISTDYVDVGSFTDAATAYPYDSGWYFGPEDRVAAVTALGRIMSSAGAQIVPGSDGRLRCLVLEAVQEDDVPTFALGTADIIRMTPRPLSLDVSLAVWRVRVAYQHNYTVQAATGILGAATEAQRQFAQSADRFSTWADASIAVAYAQAVDMPAFGGGLSDAADATTVATRVGALFGTRRWLFDCEVTLPANREREFGEAGVITYPTFATQAGARARIVGRSFDAGTMTMMLTVLI